jgi:hypothetical protein
VCGGRGLLDIRGLVRGRVGVVVDLGSAAADWAFREMRRWYAWCFLHYCGMSKDIFIVLKKSLRWIPVVGWVGFHSRVDVNCRA